MHEQDSPVTNQRADNDLMHSWSTAARTSDQSNVRNCRDPRAQVPRLSLGNTVTHTEDMPSGAEPILVGEEFLYCVKCAGSAGARSRLRAGTAPVLAGTIRRNGRSGSEAASRGAPSP